MKVNERGRLVPHILASSAAQQWDQEDVGVRVQHARHIAGLRGATWGCCLLNKIRHCKELPPCFYNTQKKKRAFLLAWFS